MFIYFGCCHARLDKAASQLFDMSEKQVETVASLMDQISNLWDVVPDVKQLQKEVNKFISQLPMGESCTDKHHNALEASRIVNSLISGRTTAWNV